MRASTTNLTIANTRCQNCNKRVNGERQDAQRIESWSAGLNTAVVSSKVGSGVLAFSFFERVISLNCFASWTWIGATRGLTGLLWVVVEAVYS